MIDAMNAGGPITSDKGAGRQAMVDDVYERLKSLVLDHVVEPGHRINVDALTRVFAVSQTPIREALARLEAEGLVVKEPLRGFRASPLLSNAEFEELYDFRMLLEPWAAARAAQRVTPDATAGLEQELGSWTSAPEGSAYFDYRELSAHDARFHGRIVALAQNGPLSTAYERLHAHLHLFRLNYRRTIGDEAIREHRAIVAAIVAGEPEAAEQAMRLHLTASRDRLREFAA
jgi:DNA-binding GntR family transcriptional regulator